MKKYGFEVVLYQDQTSLWEKLKRFYTEALKTQDKEFMRIDADIIPNENVKDLTSNKGWECATGFDWYKQDLKSISIHVMTRDIIEKCLNKIDEAKNKSRPETHLWRLPEVNEYTNTRTDKCFGLHGYAQQEHRKRIKLLKSNRQQEYDWNLIERIEAL